MRALVQSRWFAFGALAVAALLFVYETLSLQGYVGSDFRVFYDAAARFLADPVTVYNDPWKADPDAAAKTLQGFIYPPPSITLFLPLGAFSYEAAFQLFSWVALIAAIAACWMWLRMMREDAIAPLPTVDLAALIGLAIVTSPVFTCRGGQVDTIILLFCVGGVVLARSRFAWIGGALLAAGAWVKIYPALVMAWAIQTPRRWPAIIGFGVAGLLIPLASLAIMPVSLFERYFLVFMPQMSAGAIINIDNQSLSAVWLRLTQSGLDPLVSYAALTVPGPVRAAIALLSLGGIGAISWQVWRSGAPTLWIAAWILATIGPLAPLGWGHSYAYLLPLMLMVMAASRAQGRIVVLTISLVAWVLIVVPAHRQFGFLEGRPGWLWHLVYARYAIATLALMVCAWRLIAVKRRGAAFA